MGIPNEYEGEVKGFSLIYSGNFLCEAGVSETGRLRLNIGLHPMETQVVQNTFFCREIYSILFDQWQLKQNSKFCTPECVLVRSDHGIGGMSRELHRLFCDRLIPPSWADVSPPILLNTWETTDLEISEVSMIELAEHVQDS